MLKENDKIKVKEGTPNYSLVANQIGRVIRTYDFTNVVLVEFPDGLTGKIHVDNLVKVAPEETDRTIRKGGKEITKKLFLDSLAKVTSPEYMTDVNLIGNFVRGMSATIVGVRLAEKIFQESTAVTMTKDEFIVALWDGCSPENVQASTGGEMPLYKTLEVSASSISILRKIVPIIFDGESEND